MTPSFRKRFSLAFGKRFYLARVWCAVFTCAALVVSPPCTSAETKYKFLGPGSCSSSNCHGSVSPRNSSNVLQNEYITWQKKDKHSLSWNLLLNEESQKIGDHLGISQPEKDPLCLDCHATNVTDSSLHGDKFRIEDGVSCESCHGAAEGWISSHTAKNATHADNLSRGMLDITAPASRAKLCISCHLGNEQKSVNHRLIGAGHPRLTFELDTFGMIQPKHWEVDEDYTKRKGGYSSLSSWLGGQNAVALNSVDVLLSDKRSRSGAWPELTIFNCYACHHSLTEDQWKKREYHGKPGELRLNLSSLEILEQAMLVLDSSLAARLEGLGTQIRNDYPAGRGADVLNGLRQLLSEQVQTLISTHQFTDEEGRALLKQLLRFGSEGYRYQYETAEQIAMGVSSVIAALSPNGSAYQNEVNRMYQSLGQPEEFKPELFAEACKGFLAALK